MMQTIDIPRVAHVGTMHRELKKPGSMEGSGLSVSLHPLAWSSIHRIGSDGFILQGRGRFLDARSLTDGELAQIMEWGIAEGLVEPAMTHVVTYYDDELDEEISMEFATDDEARREAEELEDATFSMWKSTVATTRLAELAHHDPSMIGPNWLPHTSQTDLLIALWAERHSDVDGIWWNDRLDVDRHSAPRGVIFESRVSAWEATAADHDALVCFQSSIDEENYESDPAP